MTQMPFLLMFLQKYIYCWRRCTFFRCIFRSAFPDDTDALFSDVSLEVNLTMTQMPFCWCFFRSTFPDDICRCLDIFFLSLKFTSPALFFCVLLLRTSSWLPSTCSSQWRRYHTVFAVSQALLLPFLVLLQAAVPLWCPSTFLDDADQSSYHRLSCLYSVLPWSAFPLPSPLKYSSWWRRSLVTIKYTSCWRRYQILALY